MSAVEILTEMQAAGIRLEANGDMLRVTAPKGRVSPDIKAKLTAHKPELLVALAKYNDHGSLAEREQAADSRTATIPFGQLHMDAIKRGNAVHVWSARLGVWLWWVKGEPERRRLLDRGCKQPIYTLGELVVVAGMDYQDLPTIHALKRDMGATIKPPE